MTAWCCSELAEWHHRLIAAAPRFLAQLDDRFPFLKTGGSALATVPAAANQRTSLGLAVGYPDQPRQAGDLRARTAAPPDVAPTTRIMVFGDSVAIGSLTGWRTPSANAEIGILRNRTSSG